MYVLNVAEKPSVAKALASILSGGKYRSRESSNKYCKNYYFKHRMRGEEVEMIFTSVLGHVYSLDFVTKRKWSEVDPKILFHEPVEWSVVDSMESVHKNLVETSRKCGQAIVWTDCDREGEHIGQQIRNIVGKCIRDVKRARFSGLSSYEILRAIESLTEVNQNEANAVAVRIEIDLRIGAALTRFQSLQLSGFFADKKIVSYGSCQIPTLGFVCEREREMENFVLEEKWSLSVEVQGKSATRVFSWARGYFFDHGYVQCKREGLEGKPLTLTKIETKTVTKRKPCPLRTVELQKFFARKHGGVSNSNELMNIAETLYIQGYISYPRTETDAFSPEFNHEEPLSKLKKDTVLGAYAEKLRPDPPVQGKNNDQAHTPIYPMRDGGALNGKERAVYEYIARRFLAAYSRNAVGAQETMECSIEQEVFVHKTLRVVEKNYLEVYIYEKWGDREAKPGFDLEEGDRAPYCLSTQEGATQAPELLTEAELITLMDNNGIGTDATIHDHIQRIKEREYVTVVEKNHLKSTWLGCALIRGYQSMGLEIDKPDLRKSFEAGLKQICAGKLNPHHFAQAELAQYERIYRQIEGKVQDLKQALAEAKKQSNITTQARKPPTPSPRKKRQAKEYHNDEQENSFVKSLPPGTVVCDCNMPTKELQVKKEGANKGRLFHACAMKQCDFFQWKDGPPAKRPPPYSNPRKRTDADRSLPPETTLECGCGVLVRRKRANTDKNKGREFYSCNKAYNPCGFFKWVDEEQR